MRLRRRAIPFLVFVLVIAATSLPIWSGKFDRKEANQWTIGFVIAVFAFKAALFYAMRRRIAPPHRTLTSFGYSIIDFFFALVLFAMTFAGVFIAAYHFAVHPVVISGCPGPPRWFQLYSRTAIAGVGALIIATGSAVFYEMWKVAGRLIVHVGDEGTP